MTAPSDDPIEIAPERVAELMAADTKLQLVDVRRPEERTAERILPSLHIEMTDLTDRARTIDQTRPVYFYCHVGARSLVAAQAFRASGFDAFSVAGGIDAWERAGLPVTRGDDGA